MSQPSGLTPARLLLTWAGLLALLGIELAISYLPVTRSLRPLILIPAVLMAAIVAAVFMEIRRAILIVKLFAAAAILWLLILLALGSLDPFTRNDYPVQNISGN